MLAPHAINNPNANADGNATSGIMTIRHTLVLRIGRPVRNKPNAANQQR